MEHCVMYVTVLAESWSADLGAHTGRQQLQWFLVPSPIFLRHGHVLHVHCCAQVS